MRKFINRKNIALVMLAACLCSTAIFSVSAVGPINTEEQSKPFAMRKASLKDFDPDDSKIELSFDKSSVKKKVGKKFQVKAYINRAGYNVEYSSSNNKIAVVNEDGEVKTKKPGKVKIIAKCKDEKVACKVQVLEPESKIIEDETMSSIAGYVGKQTDYAYPNSTIMCSAYSFAYAYKQVTGRYITPGSVWTYGGCTWAGGTYRRLGSASDMLSTIKNQIDQNKACVGLLTGNGGTHYVTFYNYTGDGTTLSDYTVVDPWDGAIKNASNFGYNSYHVVTING